MQFNFTDILFTLVLFLLLLIAVFLFTSDKGKRISNILIGSFFLAICLNLLDSYLLLKRVYLQFPAFALWSSNLLLLCGPLILFYTQSVIYKDFSFIQKKLLHFVPFLVLFVAAETAYLSAGREKQVEILNNILKRKIPPGVYLFSLIIYIHFFFYFDHYNSKNICIF